MKETTIEARGMRFPAYEMGSGPTVLCLHGFPDCNRTWRHLLPALAEAGFRGVAPALRGYHPDCIPAGGSYHMCDLADDVVAIIEALGEPVHLVGHDWGAAVSYLAAALAPQRLLSVTGAAVPPLRGMRRAWRLTPQQLRNSWYMFFFQLRGIADVVVERRDHAFIEKLWRDWSPGWECPPEEMAAVKETLSRPGVRAAALGFYRAAMTPLGAGASRTRELSGRRCAVRTLVLGGDRDGCMRPDFFRSSCHAGDFDAQLKVEAIEEAGHFLQLEQPEAFNRAVIDWIRAEG